MLLRSSTTASRALGALLVAGLLSISTSSVAHDKELFEASDFRVRVQAVLRLGRAATPEARADLERGLRDSHPAVRVACAVALGDSGDRASIPALQRAMKTETFTSVKASMKASIDKIQASRSGGGTSSLARAKYVVQLGKMNNVSGVRVDDLTSVMKQVARTKADAIQGAVVVDADDATVLKRASAKRIPVLLVDGNLTRLTQSKSPAGGVVVSAQVDLSVRKVPQHVLQGMVSGNASAAEGMVRGAGLSELRSRAVGGAIESAMSSIGSEIKAFAK